MKKIIRILVKITVYLIELDNKKTADKQKSATAHPRHANDSERVEWGAE